MYTMYEVEYGAKRPLKFEEFVIECPEVGWLFDDIVDFVGRWLNVTTFANLDVIGQCRLLEKTAIEACKALKPTRDYGVSKAKVRDAIVKAIEIHGGGCPKWLTQ